MSSQSIDFQAINILRYARLRGRQDLCGLARRERQEDTEWDELLAWRMAVARYADPMKQRLIIDLATFPEEGKAFAGELPAGIFDLPQGDAKAVGPLVYDLWAQRFGNELLLTGVLSAPFEFTCVRTLHPFVQTIRVMNAAISLEIGHETEINAGEALREEVLIHFPIDPRCDEGDAPQECEIDPRYLSVDKPQGDALTTPPRAVSDDPWSALDELKDLKDQP